MSELNNLEEFIGKELTKLWQNAEDYTEFDIQELIYIMMEKIKELVE